MIPKFLKNLLELIVILTMGFYCIYALKIINIPINSFISSSAAIILSILKLTPVISQSLQLLFHLKINMKPSKNILIFLKINININ